MNTKEKIEMKIEELELAKDIFQRLEYEEQYCNERIKELTDKQCNEEGELVENLSCWEEDDLAKSKRKITAINNIREYLMKKYA